MNDKELVFSSPNLKSGVVVSGSEELMSEPNEKTSLSLFLEPKLNDGMLASPVSSSLVVAADDAMVGVGGGSEKAAGVEETGKVKLKPLS